MGVTILDSRPHKTCVSKEIFDSFKKVVIVKDNIRPWHNQKGILIMGLMDFLLNPNSLDF